MLQFKPCERAGGWLRLQCRVCLKYLKVYLEAEAALCLQRFFSIVAVEVLQFLRCCTPPVVLGRVPRIVGICEPACAPGVLTKRSRFWIDYMCTSLVSVAGKFRDL